MEEEFQGWELNETDEFDVILQYNIETLVEAMYKLDLAAAQNSEMEWSKIEMESSETYEGRNNGEDVTERLRGTGELTYGMERYGS